MYKALGGPQSPPAPKMNWTARLAKSPALTGRLPSAVVVGEPVGRAVRAVVPPMAEGAVWQPAYVGLGSNLDGPVDRVLRAFTQLAGLPQTQLVARSSLWHTPPVGPVEQPPFVNAVAGLLTQLSPRELLDVLLAAERLQGRQRELRWGPRTLDLDLLVYGAGQVDEPGLTVPHPEMSRRAFVLYPLAEVAPTLSVPGQGRVAALAAAADGAGLERLIP
jgi:2-amino-4-hydroxy-6-hydroxymethyldihydropteridine diphosphokinase